MPGSGTSWRAADLPTWEEARPALVTALNRLERDVATILSELRDAERREAGDEVRRQTAAIDLSALRALVEKLRDVDIPAVRHRVAGVEQILKARDDAEEREEKAEVRSLRRKILQALGLLGTGAGTLYGLLQAFGG